MKKHPSTINGPNFKNTKIPTTISGQPYVKRSDIPKRKELENSVITKATEVSSQEIIKNDEAMFSQFEPKTNNRFIVKITDDTGKEVIPSYCIKSISRPMFVKKFFGFKVQPTEMSFYDPINPFLGKAIQEVLEKNETLTITLNVLGPIGDIVEQWKLTDTKILGVEYSNMNWCSSQPAEILVIAQAKTAKLTIK